MRQRFPSRLLPLAITLLVGLPLRPADAAPQPERVILAGSVPDTVRQAQRVGPLASDAPVSLALALPLRHQTQLDDLLRRLYDSTDPQFGHYLTSAQFTERFGPNLSDYQAVADWARAQGLTVTGTHPNRLLLDVAGPAQTVEAAFGVRLSRYQAADGHRFRAPESVPSVPRALAGRLSGVVGLSDGAVRRPFLRRLSDAQPLTEGTGPRGGLTPSDIRTAYNLSGVGLNGNGQTLAVFELDGYDPNDISAYESQFGLPSVSLQTITVDGFSGTPGAGSDEVTLDIEMQLALASGVSKLLVYETGQSDTDIADTYNKIATDNQAKQVSTSWGLDEQENVTSFLQQENAIFQQMAAQGQTIYAAAGDHGAYDTGKTTDGLRVDDPASQPYVCAVGGTSLTTTAPGGTYVSEKTWNQGTDGASGGGVSSIWPIPSWQQGINTGNSEVSSSSRNVPDISLNADPNSGYAIYWQGAWHVYGGASCAAPLWAGFTALVNQQRASSGLSPLGQASPALYAIAKGTRYATDFHDIADSSDNLYYHALPGYDLATGLGTFNGANLLADLAPGAQTPSQGPAIVSYSAGLNFVSLPYDYSAYGPDAVLGYSGVLLYTWDPAILQYVLTPTAPADHLRLGQGYWVRFPSAVSVTAQGVPAPTNAPFSLGLAAGWDMIGDPFLGNVTVGNLKVVAGGQTYSFGDAAGASLIGGSVYRYNPGGNSYATLGAGDALQPGQGYWVHASQNVALQVPPP